MNANAHVVAGLRPIASGPTYGPKCNLAQAITPFITQVVDQGWGLAVAIGAPLVLLALIVAVLTWRRTARMTLLSWSGMTIVLLIALAFVIPVMHLFVGGSCT